MACKASLLFHGAFKNLEVEGTTLGKRRRSLLLQFFLSWISRWLKVFCTYPLEWTCQPRLHTRLRILSNTKSDSNNTEQSHPRFLKINCEDPSLSDVFCCSYQGLLALSHHRRGCCNIPTGRSCWWCNTMASSHHRDFYSSFPLGSWNTKLGSEKPLMEA